MSEAKSGRRSELIRRLYVDSRKKTCSLFSLRIISSLLPKLCLRKKSMDVWNIFFYIHNFIVACIGSFKFGWRWIANKDNNVRVADTTQTNRKQIFTRLINSPPTGTLRFAQSVTEGRLTNINPAGWKAKPHYLISMFVIPNNARSRRNDPSCVVDKSSAEMAIIFSDGNKEGELP